MRTPDAILAVVGRKASVGAIVLCVVAVAVVTGLSIGRLLAPVPLVFAAYARIAVAQTRVCTLAAGVALPAQELGDLRREGGLEEQPDAEPGHLLQDLG